MPFLSVSLFFLTLLLRPARGAGGGLAPTWGEPGQPQVGAEEVFHLADDLFGPLKMAIEVLRLPDFDIVEGPDEQALGFDAVCRQEGPRHAHATLFIKVDRGRMAAIVSDGLLFLRPGGQRCQFALEALPAIGGVEDQATVGPLGDDKGLPALDAEIATKTSGEIETALAVDLAGVGAVERGHAGPFEISSGSGLQ